MSNLLVEKHLDSIVKIKTFDSNDEKIKIFTGNFYVPQDFDNPNNYFPYFRPNKIFIVTAKHAIRDNKIAKLEISFYYNQKLQVNTINLNEFTCIDIPECDDLTVIHIKKEISYNSTSVIFKSMIFSPDKVPGSSILNYWVYVPGYYEENINSCILEFATICSQYNSDKFYIKSKNIIEGYSGAPVFIELYSQSNILEIFLIGYVSKEAGNYNIEVTSAENLLLIDEILKRKYSS
jgi:hypothetical protein|nr:MAG TPA: Serine protease SplB [Caudoviricetes sp.]